MSFAWLANLSVPSVWKKFLRAGETQQMSRVLELPPSASVSRRVSLESLKGMCFCFSANLLITFVRVKRLLFMYPVSFYVFVSESVNRSDPARSIRFMHAYVASFSLLTYMYY
jgi:hypothetical protein